jgi:ketosteroid isomerase-like protein
MKTMSDNYKGIAMKALALLGSITVFALVSAAGAAGTATPESQVGATVKAVVDNFNKGDMKTVGAMMSPDGVNIIDEIPPHSWSGVKAFDTWVQALADFEKANAVTDDNFTASKPTRIVVSGDHAYAVQPVLYSYKKAGVAMQESSRMVYTLQNGKSGWMVTGFVWAAGVEKPVADAAKK